MARNKYNELKKARKAKMQKLRLQHAMWGTLLVEGSTFGYSVLAFIVVGYIYAQAVHIGLLNVTDYWFVSPVTVTVLHLAFVVLLFALSFSKGISESRKELL